MATVSYFIHPTSELKKVLSDYPNHDWVNPQLWEMEEHRGIHRGLPFDYKILAKALYLIQIARMENADTITKSLVSRLFGELPAYNIALFEKWWSIERVGTGWYFATTLREAQPRHYAVIEKTAFYPIDEWLRRMADAVHDTELRYTHDGITDYVRYPTLPLLEVVKEKPDNLWARKALWRLPSNIISHQDQHNTNLLKVLDLIELARSGIPYGTKQNWMNLMFGEPPCYSIENFDKWWTIQQTKCVGGFRQIIDSFSHDEALQRAFRRVELTGHEGNDAWLKRMGVGLDKS